MPITENNFEVDELVEVVAANPEVLTKIQSFAEKQGGYFASDATAKSTYENNLKTLHNSELTNEIATKNEKMVFELTGVKKADPQQKWYDYAGEVLKTLSAADKAKATELANLKSKTDLSAAERARILELETLSKTKSDEVESIKKAHASEIVKLKAENKIYAGIGQVDAKLKQTPELQEAIKIVRNQVLKEMTEGAKIDEQGNVFFLKADGNFMTNADASKMTIEQVYAARMATWIDTGRQQGGAGGNGGNDGGNGAVGNFKSQYEVDQFLGSKGFIPGTKEFSIEREKLGASKLPVTI